MNFGRSIEAAGGKDLFLEEILVYLQEAIDGGYSKTHTIAFGWHPKDGVIEMRGTDRKKVLVKMLDDRPGVTRIAMCRQRLQEDAGYVVQMIWASPMLLDHNYTRVYQMPLSEGKYLDLGPLVL